MTAHTLRHHAITLIERHAGKAVAVAFARHEPEYVNGQYGRASREEVAQAAIAVHGVCHPWVDAGAAPCERNEDDKENHQQD